MRLALIFFTRRGGELAGKLAACLGEEGHICDLSGPARFAEGLNALPYERLGSWTADRFPRRDGLIFVSACGIAVRAIAPHVRDKLTDPAVVSVDEAGRFAVPLLSGHVGGANDLARKIASITGGAAVISTATDVNHRFAVDQWAVRQGMAFDQRELAKRISAALLAGQTIGAASDYPMEGPLPEGLTRETAELGFYVTSRTGQPDPFPETLRLWPKVLHLGIGCRRDTPPERVAEAVERVLEEHHLARAAVKDISSIDLKKDEEALRVLSEQNGWPLCFYTAEELRDVEGAFTPSSFVKSITGVDNVCERAAVKCGGKLIVPKTAGNGVTVAVAEALFPLSFPLS